MAVFVGVLNVFCCSVSLSLFLQKTLRYKHDFTDRNYDRHRKDALASERLSGSPNVVDIFAYCSNSAVFEYGRGGDIDGVLWKWDDEEEKYYVADIPAVEKVDMGACPRWFCFVFGVLPICICCLCWYLFCSIPSGKRDC